MSQSRKDLVAHIDRESRRPLDPGSRALADDVRRHCGPGVLAILHYGSALRTDDENHVLDFYVLVDSYRATYPGRPVYGVMNRLLPPNVFSHTVEHGARTLRCKYAVIRIDQFAHRASTRAATPQIWARFAQPCRIMWVRDERTRESVLAALSTAAVTFHEETLRLLRGAVTVRDLWRCGLLETYARELRSEGARRPEALYDSAPDYFDRITEAAIPHCRMPAALRDGMVEIDRSRAAVRRARLGARIARPMGKAVSLLRLMKSAFTYSGGVDYILWKIERHSGVRLEATPWQKRHPLLGGWSLLWRLYKRGAFR